MRKFIRRIGKIIETILWGKYGRYDGPQNSGL